jgi:D-tagatose-1,6-bisphosphate aldolase subunit GatZ/KbaZ
MSSINNIKKFKLGFGPMSREIIRILADYTKEKYYPLMIIASRNQIDFDSGYVCTTKELAEQLKEYRGDNLLLCRDHCGPYFSDADRNLTLNEAVIRCKKTIQADIENGFDLIHIDVSRVKDNPLAVATDLIDFTLGLKPDIMLEFGSEDNTGIDLNGSLGRIDSQLEFLAKYNKNVKFFVTQTGSLTKSHQRGVFDIEHNRQAKMQINNAGFLFKEHNADYFTENDINLRLQAGVDSLNIAPQLGKIQTDLLKEFAPRDLWDKFADLVYSQGYWQRWVEPGVTDRDIAVSVSGHYCFGSKEYVDIIAAIDAKQFNFELKTRIEDMLKLYRTFDSEFDEEEAEFQRRLQERLAELRKRDPFIYR